MLIERKWKRWVYFYVPLTVFVVGTLFPFYWMLITAIRPDAELYRSWRAATNTPFWTLQPTLEHFRDLMAKTTFPQWLWNTFFIAVVSTAISLFCGLLAGYALARLRFPMAGTLGTSIFVTYLVPPTLLFIPLANIIRTFQLGDTPWALILTYPTFLIPFCTWLLMGYFKTIPKELEECARIDGATRFAAMSRSCACCAGRERGIGGARVGCWDAGSQRGGKQRSASGSTTCHVGRTAYSRYCTKPPLSPHTPPPTTTYREEHRSELQSLG